MSPGNPVSKLMMCGLLSPFLFASLGGGVAASREQLVIIDSHREMLGARGDSSADYFSPGMCFGSVKISHRNWT